MPSRPRAYWKGYLRLSLVSIGVELYAATASADATALHQIHKPSGKRVRYEKIVPGVGPIEASDIVKGFEIDDDAYVVLEPEELEQIKLESSRAVELAQFVDRAEIASSPKSPCERTADGYLRRPSFIGLREDKPASQVKAREAMKNDAIPKREDPATSSPATRLTIQITAVSGAGVTKAELAPIGEESRRSPCLIFEGVPFRWCAAPRERPGCSSNVTIRAACRRRSCRRRSATARDSSMNS